MKPKLAAIIRHSIDSLFIIISAVLCVWLILVVTRPYYKELSIWIAQVKFFAFVLIIAISVFWGWLFPRQVIASIRSLKLWPKHWGLAVRVFIGCILAVVLTRLPKLLEIEIKWFVLGTIFVESFLLLVGCGIAKFHLWLFKSLRCSGDSQHSDDKPISRLEENLFPEHEISARRILEQLKLGEDTEGRGPNVAVIGPYGSGKTSLCNIVEDIYQKEHAQRDGGVLLFCRFEAWQFITADAAVRGLLDEIVNTVEEEVDCSGLGKIPEEYLEALRAYPNWWLRVIASILRRRNPEEIMKALQDVLLRINKRVIVFVDDFDRLESSMKETQKIIAAALNQLQNLTYVQYVLCVGPMREGIGADLLKLTRFQEQMPEMSGEKVIERIKVLRDEIISRNDKMYYLWSLVEHRSDEPLHYSSMTEFLSSNLSSQLVKLIRTPRQLKAVEHETYEKWNGGLNGEISWYDLLLISALKVSEPRVFEWIIREPEIFFDVKPYIIGKPTEEEKNEEKSIIEKQLRELIEVKTRAHFELVQQVLLDLFPSFMEGLWGLGQKMSRRVLRQWDQRIAQQPRYGTSYFRRYTSGAVPSTEVSDQLTLQYIRDINKNGLKQREFEQRFLDSSKKLTNDCNRFVQFSGLLSQELATEVCDCILDWMCDRQHWSMWEREERYVSDMMPDVKSIINNAGQFEFAQNWRKSFPTEEESTGLEEWAKNQLKELVSKDIIVAIEYAHYVAETILGKNEAKTLLRTTLKENFLSDEDAIWEKAIGHCVYLYWILNVLKDSENYEGFRKQVTSSVLKRTGNEKYGKFVESIVISLVHYQYPAGKPDLIERYEFHVNKEENQKIYDMDMLLSLIAKWKERRFEDPIATKAYEHILKVYAKELNGISPTA